MFQSFPSLSTHDIVIQRDLILSLKIKLMSSRKRKRPTRQPDPNIICPSCGKPGHSRITNKDCLNYQPRLQTLLVTQLKGNDPNAKTKRATTVMGLKSFIKRQELLPIMQDVVSRVTDIYGEASRAVVLFVLNRIHNGLELPKMEFGNGLMLQFFEGVCGYHRAPLFDPTRRNRVRSETVNEFLDDIYSPMRPENLPWNDGRYLHGILSTTATLYSANCLEHVLKHISKVIVILCKIEFHQQTNNVVNTTKQMLDKVEAYIIARFYSPEDAALVLTFGNVEEELSTQLRTTFLDILAARLQTSLNGLPFRASEVARDWTRYIPALHSLQIALEPLVTNQPLAEFKIPIRPFSILPITDHVQKHVLVDTRGLFLIYKAAFPNGITKDNGEVVPIPTERLFRANHEEWWRDAVNIKATSSGRPFAYSFSTDGVKACLHIIKKVPGSDHYVNEWGYRYNGDYQRLETTQDDTRIIGLDPGRNNLFVAAWGHDERYEGGRVDVNDWNVFNHQSLNGQGTLDPLVKYSNERWLDESGRVKTSKKEEFWNGQNGGLYAIITQIPTAKCHSTATFHQHLQYYLQHREIIVGYYRPTRWRRLRFKTYSLRQRAYANMARMLTGRRLLDRYNATIRNTVVAYGGGKFDSSSRGLAPTPNKKLFEGLRKYLVVRKTPERLTTAVCSLCEGDLTDVEGNSSIKQCKNICLVTWNRDVNAARNIRYVFMFKNDHAGVRPEPFFDHNQNR